MRKETRTRIKLGDYLVFPFTKLFESPHEATQYANRLKTKILPSLRELIDSYKTQSSQQTIEF